MREIVVLSGSAHRPLAKSICDYLGVPLSSVEIRRFSNDCLYVQLQENCRQRDVYVIQPLVAPTQEHLMELLLMLDAARGASAAEITAVIPHYAYPRSDKKDASRISIAGRLVADMLLTAGASRVLTMTLHAPQVHGFFSVPVDHLTAIGELADHFRSRDLDDTVVELLDRLAEQDVPSAAVACTHGLFAGKALPRLHDHPMVSEIVTTDTVPQAPDDWPLLTIRSVAGLFAE